MTHMIRKQIYILKRHQAMLKKLAQARGLSQAEIVRQALDEQAQTTSRRTMLRDRSALPALVRLAHQRRRQANAGKPYRFDRTEIYEPREKRWAEKTS